MLSREDFVFTIGYDGPAAVVDNQAKKKYGKLSTRELTEKGLFRAAYSSAVYSRDLQELKYVAEAFNRLRRQSAARPAEADLPEMALADLKGAGLSEADVSEADTSSLDRLFGVFPVDVSRAIFL